MAAVTITSVPACSTPHQIRYLLTNSGPGAAAANLDLAAMLATSVPGPLQTILRDTAIANQAAGRAFAFGRDDLQIQITPRAGVTTWTVDGDTNGTGGLRLTFASAATDAVGSVAYIWYKHTTPR